MQWPYKIDHRYNRRSDIHARYGGQQQSGISTPSSAPVIFLFTGNNGAKHGYGDAYQSDGLFSYSGEGQYGDMEMTRGNRAIRDHLKNGKDLLLFEALGVGQPIRYMGEFTCSGWSFHRQPDTLGKMRNAIVFALAPVAIELRAAVESH